MDYDKLLTGVAGVLVALPNLAGTVAGLDLSPSEHFVLLIVSLIGAAVLKQTKPVGRSLTAEDVRRIAAEQERIRMGLVRARAARKTTADE